MWDKLQRRTLDYMVHGIRMRHRFHYLQRKLKLLLKLALLLQQQKQNCLQIMKNGKFKGYLQI